MKKLFHWVMTQISGGVRSPWFIGGCVKLLAVLIDVCVPACVLLSYFPLWVETSDEQTISGLAVVILLVCAIPGWRYVQKFLKSPSNWKIWLLIWAVAAVFCNIAMQVKVIAFYGAVANCIGAALYSLGNRIQNKGAVRVVMREE